MHVNLNDPRWKVCKNRFCAKDFYAKRLNQEYCCYECKVKENNWKDREVREALKKYTAVMKKNMEALKSLSKGIYTTVTRAQLLAAGFNFYGPASEFLNIRNNRITKIFSGYSLETGDGENFVLQNVTQLCIMINNYYNGIRKYLPSSNH